VTDTGDLDRLGEALTEATALAVAARRRRLTRRRRVVAGAGAGLLVFAMTTPSRLVPADSPSVRLPLTLAAMGAPGGEVALGGRCDTLHGGYGSSPCVIVRLSPQLR
jgi:hypothetical protein